MTTAVLCLICAITGGTVGFICAALCHISGREDKKDDRH